MKNQVFEKKDSTNFEIINNISYNSLDCENIIDNDENNSLEDSIEEIYINNTKKKQNLINDDIENKNDKGKLKINEHEDDGREQHASQIHCDERHGKPQPPVPGNCLKVFRPDGIGEGEQGLLVFAHGAFLLFG